MGERHRNQYRDVGEEGPQNGHGGRFHRGHRAITQSSGNLSKSRGGPGTRTLERQDAKSAKVRQEKVGERVFKRGRRIRRPVRPAPRVVDSEIEKESKP